MTISLGATLTAPAKINMILWIVMMAAACALNAAQEQPVACSDNGECASGFFCRQDDNRCSQCLRCEDLHRQPPTGDVSCVRLISECGLCLKGYVDDRMGSGCIQPEADSAAWYMWLLLALAIACLLFCAGAVVVYALRNTDSFRVLASTNTSVEAPLGGKPVAPTAPQPPHPSQPPPYNYDAPYEPVRPASPDADPPAPYASGDYAYRPTSDSEAERPLVKRAAKAAGGRAARESAGSQNARVYTNPAYVRNVPPPSYESALSDDSDQETGAFQPLDEETMPSDWTPAAAAALASALASGAAASGEAAASSGAGPVARRPPPRDLPASPPPNKMRCVEDSNNNHSGGGSSGSALPPSPPPAAPAPAAPHVVINVLNVNAVHQRNDVTL